MNENQRAKEHLHKDVCAAEKTARESSWLEWFKIASMQGCVFYVHLR